MSARQFVSSGSSIRIKVRLTSHITGFQRTLDSSQGDSLDVVPRKPCWHGTLYQQSRLPVGFSQARRTAFTTRKRCHHRPTGNERVSRVAPSWTTSPAPRQSTRERVATRVSFSLKPGHPCFLLPSFQPHFDSAVPKQG